MPLLDLEDIYSYLDMEILIGASDLILLRKHFLQMIAATIRWSDTQTHIAGLPDPSNDQRKQICDRLGLGVLPQLDIYTLLLLYATGAWNSEPRENLAFITLNYDTLLERRMKALNIEPDYGTGIHWPHLSGRKLPVLKLHGSTNWAVCGEPTEKCQPVVFDPIAKGPWLTDVGCACTRPRDSLWLAPPTWNKSELRGVASRIWENAFMHLVRAKRLFIIGCSLPTTDLYLKHLLRAALSRNQVLEKVYVVNKGSGDTDKQYVDVLQRYKELFTDEYWESHVDCRFALGGVEGLVNNQWSPLLPL